MSQKSSKITRIILIYYSSIKPDDSTRAGDNLIMRKCNPKPGITSIPSIFLPFTTTNEKGCNRKKFVGTVTEKDKTNEINKQIITSRRELRIIKRHDEIYTDKNTIIRTADGRQVIYGVAKRMRKCLLYKYLKLTCPDFLMSSPVLSRLAATSSLGVEARMGERAEIGERGLCASRGSRISRKSW